MFQVDIGEDEIGPDAQQRPGGLDQYALYLGTRLVVVQVGGGAGDQYEPEGRAYQAQSQQLHIRLAYDIRYKLQHPLEDLHGVAS